MDDNACVVCSSTNLRYDEEHCRFICNICNAMQEITGIGITTYENDPNINYERLKTYNLKRKLKFTKDEKAGLKLKDAQPWELQQLFKWIFDKQVESLKPYVVDSNDFINLSNAIWNKYMKATGNNFNIIEECNDNIKMQKYPIGWGASYDPKHGINLLAKSNLEFSKYQRNAVGSDNDDDNKMINDEKMEKNAKKIRIERMIHMKRLDKDAEKNKQSIPKLNDDLLKQELDFEIKESLEEKMEIKAEKILKEENQFNSSSEDDESAFSDEEDDNFLQLDIMDEKEKNKVRILRKKKPHEVMWTGCYYTNASRYMENNIIILFLSIYFSQHKKDNCCCLMDILRLVKTRIIPYIRIIRFIPSDLFYVNDRSYKAFLLRDHVPSWNYMVVCLHKLLKDLRFPYLIRFNMDQLINRLVKDLNLPYGFVDLIKFLRYRLKSFDDKKAGIKKDSSLIRTNNKNIRHKYGYTVLPEPMAIAYIFIVLRSLFKLDGKYEHLISRLVGKLVDKNIIEQGQLFVWNCWWKQMYKAPTLYNAKTWEDIDKVTDSSAFLEQGFANGDNKEDYKKLGLHWDEEIVNHRGRSVRQRLPGSHQLVIDNMLKPLRKVFDDVKEILNDQPQSVNTDYTNCQIDYLTNPNVFFTQLKEDISMSQDNNISINQDNNISINQDNNISINQDNNISINQDNNISINQDNNISINQDNNNSMNLINQFQQIITNNNLSYNIISYPQPDFNDDVFHPNFEYNITPLESDLLRTLTHNSGFSCKDVLRHVFVLEKQLCKPVVKKLDKRRRKKK